MRRLSTAVQRASGGQAEGEGLADDWRGYEQQRESNQRDSEDSRTQVRDLSLEILAGAGRVHERHDRRSQRAAEDRKDNVQGIGRQERIGLASLSFDERQKERLAGAEEGGCQEADGDDRRAVREARLRPQERLAGPHHVPFATGEHCR